MNIVKMSKNKQVTEKEYKSRIDAVIDYILKNLNNDISLQALSNVANYSPYHLQKIFKQVIGKTPKQYIIKLKIETSLHLIIIHPHKSIIEIATECGFSSPSVFSRAFKNYFGVSPEKISTLTTKEKVEILKKINHLPTFKVGKNYESTNDIELIVRITKIETVKGVYLNTPFNDSIQIQQSFKDLMQLVKTHDIFNADSKYFGILSPHQGNIYKGTSKNLFFGAIV